MSEIRSGTESSCTETESLNLHGHLLGVGTTTAQVTTQTVILGTKASGHLSLTSNSKTYPIMAVLNRS